MVEPVKVAIISNQPGRIMEEKQYFVYILASKKYNVHRLVYYEIHSDIYEAITREKRIKKWYRQWKINLIEQNNPQWLDLGIGLF